LSEQALGKIVQGGALRRDGVAKLYASFARPFQGFFMRNRMSREVAEDLVQDTFVQIVRACDQFRGDCPLEAWLWRIARNTLISHVRKVKPAPTIPAWMMTILPMRSKAIRLCRPRLRSMKVWKNASIVPSKPLLASTPERAESLTLATVEGWSMNDIAAFLGRSPGATREYVSQCRKLLRPFLEHCRDYLAAA
jgi:RNA polymerase sigma-70 factor (ECF subfamily)